jgi:hypothetical protein
MEAEQQLIQKILSQPCPRPPFEVCHKISTMKDLYETGPVYKNDWRRGSPTMHESSSSSSLGGFQPAPLKKPMFRGGAPEAPAAPQPSAGPPGKYQSKFKNSNQPVNDKILNNIILSKLNKFSDKTYADIRDFLYQILGSGEPDLQEMVRDFMKLVFRKAATEEVFCHLYAKLLCELSSRYSVILQEMKALHSNYISIFDNVQKAEKTDYDTFVEDQKDRRYRHGYSQFIAELCALQILDLDFLNMIFVRILQTMEQIGKVDGNKPLVEEYSDCLACMAKVLKKKKEVFFINARKTLFDTNNPIIHTMMANRDNYVSVSQKARFTLMDVIDILKE